MNNEAKKIKTIKGTVVSNKMDKTVTILVNRIKTHPLYKKKYTVSKKHKADDPENTYQIGDVVEIVSVKPISKDKCFRVLRKIEEK